MERREDGRHFITLLVEGGWEVWFEDARRLEYCCRRWR
jgi:hypothetical protein